MSSIWPTQPADQVGRLRDSFVAATRLLPTTDEEAKFAGYPVRLSVAGAELASSLKRALIAKERSRSCDLSVELWDSTAAPGVFVPPVPSGLRTYGLVTSDADGRFIVDSRPNGLLILDRLENRIVGYYAGASSLFLDERARPLHRLLSVWLGDRGVQFIHAGVVSTGDAGILLAGGGSKLPGLADFLTSRFEIPVEVFNPFRHIEVDERKFDPDYMREIVPEMAVAVGLALRGVEA